MRIRQVYLQDACGRLDLGAMHTHIYEASTGLASSF